MDSLAASAARALATGDPLRALERVALRGESPALALRGIDPETGEVRVRLAMPSGVAVSGLEADGAGVFYCGVAPTARCAPCAAPEKERER